MDEEIARKVIRRSPKCPICGKRRATEIHHIMHGSPFNRALSEKYSDACLIYICGKCHDKIHHSEDADEKQDSLDWKLKAQAELDFEKYYPEDSWFDTFGRHYAIGDDYEEG